MWYALTATDVLNYDGYLTKLKELTGDYYDDVLSGMIEHVFDYCYVLEKEEDDDQTAVHKLAYSMYKFLLDENDMYNKEKSLLANITVGTTKTTSRFNDTPQNGGDWSDDQHTSTITTNEVIGTADTIYQLKLLKDLRIEYINHFRNKYEIMQEKTKL